LPSRRARFILSSHFQMPIDAFADADAEMPPLAPLRFR
jgi:hypothetical protein